MDFGTTTLLLGCVFFLARSAWTTLGTLQGKERRVGQTYLGSFMGQPGTEVGRASGSSGALPWLGVEEVMGRRGLGTPRVISLGV